MTVVTTIRLRVDARPRAARRSRMRSRRGTQTAARASAPPTRRRHGTSSKDREACSRWRCRRSLATSSSRRNRAAARRSATTPTRSITTAAPMWRRPRPIRRDVDVKNPKENLTKSARRLRQASRGEEMGQAQLDDLPGRDRGGGDRADERKARVPQFPACSRATRCIRSGSRGRPARSAPRRPIVSSSRCAWAVGRNSEAIALVRLLWRNTSL